MRTDNENQDWHNNKNTVQTKKGSDVETVPRIIHKVNETIVMNPDCPQRPKENTPFHDFDFQLEDNNNHPLTEQSGQIIITLLKESLPMLTRELPQLIHRFRFKLYAEMLWVKSITHSLRTWYYSFFSSLEIIDNFKENNTIEGDAQFNDKNKIKVGSNTWWAVEKYKDLCRQTEIAPFFTNVCHAVWGDELAERVVRKQSNTQYAEIEPKKKDVVINVFEKWLRDERHYPDHLIQENLQRSKLNSLFNRAITATRKRVNKNISNDKRDENTHKKKKDLSNSNDHIQEEEEGSIEDPLKHHSDHAEMNK